MRSFALVAALVLALAVVGCGDGGDGTDSSSTTGSSGETSTSGSGEEGQGSGGDTSSAKAAFIRKADAACTRNNTKTNQEVEAFLTKEAKSGESEVAIQEAATSEVIAPAVARQAGYLEGLPAPPGEEEAVAAIAAAIREGAKQVESDPSSYMAGGFSEASSLAREFGLVVCGGE